MLVAWAVGLPLWCLPVGAQQAPPPEPAAPPSGDGEVAPDDNPAGPDDQATSRTDDGDDAVAPAPSPLKAAPPAGAVSPRHRPRAMVEIHAAPAPLVPQKGTPPAEDLEPVRPSADNPVPPADAAEERSPSTDADAGESRLRAADRDRPPEDPPPTQPDDALDGTSDGWFLGTAAAVGGAAGLATVGFTAASMAYTGLQVANIAGPRFTRDYWQWWLLGLVPVVVSLAAIPLGSAFGTWWGAGLRGLPLSLAQATGHMLVGHILGLLTGSLALAAAGYIAVMPFAALAALALSGTTTFASGPLWGAAVGVAVMLGYPVLFGLLPGAALGGLLGAAIGPVFTAGHWGRWAKAKYVE